MKQKLAIIAWILLILFSFAPFASAQWQQVGPPNVEVYGLGSFDNYVFAGTDKGLFRSSDTGNNWEAVNNGLRDSTEVGSFTAIGTELFVGTQTFIFRSSNWGASWIEADSGYSPPAPLRDLATSGTIIYACGANAFGVWRSEDSGKTWIRGGSGIANLNRIYSITTIGTTVFVTSADGVFRSADSARSWSGSINSDTSYFVIRANNNVLYTANGYDVFLSKNLGQSWSLFNSGLLGVEAFAFNGSDIFACGSGEVFRITDNNGVWTSINQGLPINHIINSLAINGGYIFAGVSPQNFGSNVGSGIWRRSLSDFSIVNSKLVNISKFKLLSNPTTTSADFQFDALQEPAVFELFDALGRSRLRRELPAGQTSLHVDMQAFPAGIYFARLGLQSVRFIKL